MAPNDQIQINLDNDTANYRAHHLVLSLTQSGRPANTTRAYKGKVIKWTKFCNDHNYDNGQIVYEAKLVRFLQERVLSCPCANENRDHDVDDDDGDEDNNENNGRGDDAEQDQISPVEYNTVRGYKTALIDLWSYQSSRSRNPHPHPNGAALQALLKDKQRSQTATKKANYEDRGRGTIADGYDTSGLRRIVDEFWAESHSTKASSVGGFLRGRLDFLLSHHLLARGEARRFAELPDLQLLMLENEGPSPCPALLYISANGKTNQNGRIEYTGLLRHKDVTMCAMSAMALYFFWRWEQSGELFPSFKSNKDWYNTKLLIPSPKTPEKGLSDTTQRVWIKKIYKSLDLNYTKVTHAGRGSGSRIAELLNIDESQIRRAGN